MKTLTDEKLPSNFEKRTKPRRYDWFEYGSDSHHDGTYF